MPASAVRLPAKISCARHEGGTWGWPFRSWVCRQQAQVVCESRCTSGLPHTAHPCTPAHPHLQLL